jgi:hypothetical protein
VPDLVNAGISAARGDWQGVSLSAVAAVPILGAAANTARLSRTAAKTAGKAKAASKVGGKSDGARFISQPDGKVVDTKATPGGSYRQSDGSRTDILQKEDHGAGLSHTHEAITNTNSKTGETFVNGTTKPGRPVSADDVQNIRTGAAERIIKGRQ